MATFNYWQDYVEGYFYHMYNHGVHDIDLFREKFDFQYYLEKFKLYFSPYFEVYAYCLMPNHYHFIVRVREEEDIRKEIANLIDSKAKTYFLKGEIPLDKLIEDQFRRMHSSYTLKMKRIYKNWGPLFLSKHKRVRIHFIEKILKQICYVHHNPIHHHFTNNYISWPYSSYHQLIHENNSLIETGKVFQLFGGKNDFIKSHENFRLK